MSKTIPAPGEYTIEVTPGAAPDGEGRVQFIARWADEHALNGFRGQVFHTNIASFTARAERERMSVRVLEG
ncbi:hypothetical protein [Streptomyces sp. t39]|uniref:hypothetical protein n=1 Tax=Streptomyces sp. t39 TaxID=1828156 RepID=UPI0011CE71ED|nr:hypothetical protein [Streptomyces sp. t39]TXS35260.1 hypothetical protein EAO77_37215 [Streptomyces sp. t39]